MQGICFLGKLRFDDFLQHYLGEAPGDVVWLENDLVIGKREMTPSKIMLQVG